MGFRPAPPPYRSRHCCVVVPAIRTWATLPLNTRSGNASTVNVTSWPASTKPISASSTSTEDFDLREILGELEQDRCLQACGNRGTEIDVASDHDAVDGRADLRSVEIEFCLRQVSLALGNGRLCVGELRLRDLQIGLGGFEKGFGGLQRAGGGALVAASVRWRSAERCAWSSSAWDFTMVASWTVTVVLAMARLASAEATRAAKVRGSMTARMASFATLELKSLFSSEICPEAGN